MTVGLQGSWTVSVQSKNAGWGQRFRIEGSTNGVDGTYAGTTSTPAVFATGPQWGVTVEHNPPGPADWTASRHRIGNFHVSGGLFRFDISTDDTGGDEDFDDLVLTCSMPLSATDWVVYGTVKTYRGFCGVNPCFPRPWIVIDTLAQLRAALAFEPVRSTIAKLYPEEVELALRRPFPEPDPPPFRPMVIPTGLPDEGGFLVAGATELDVPEVPKGRSRAKARAVTVSKEASLRWFSTTSKTPGLIRDDLVVLGKLKNRLLRYCEVDPVAETLLRFLEYDRTAAELGGGPYTGEGDREVLGMTATDEIGNYVFRFPRSIGELLQEAADIAAGEEAVTAALPDVIVQIINSLPDGVAFETAPHYNIPNVRRIDLCIPESALVGVGPACQAGRAVQFLGNISILPNPHSQLHADGTVSNAPTSVSGPHVQHAAWRGIIHVYGCFKDTTPKVARYTFEYRREGEGWNFVNEPYRYLKKQLDGTWDSDLVGPFDHSLRIHGPADPKVTVPAYDNIEEDTTWADAHRSRKICLTTSSYQATFGAVHFRIQGYDATGEKVPGAVDTFKLLIDQVWSTGDIDFVKLVGGTDPGECALLELPSVGAPLVVRYRVRDPEGFLRSFSLTVLRGSNHPVGISGGLISGSYQNVAPFRYEGTPDEAGADLDGYVEVAVTPVTGDWLEGHSFCAFAFSLGATDRTTDGLGVPGGRTVWTELIGLSAPSGTS